MDVRCEFMMLVDVRGEVSRLAVSKDAKATDLASKLLNRWKPRLFLEMVVGC